MIFSNRKTISVKIQFPKGTENGTFLSAYLPRIESFLRDNGLHPDNHQSPPHFHAAISGGADSLFLAFLLHLFLEKRHPLTLLHFNHRTRGMENEEDEIFLRNFAQHIGRPLRIGVLSEPVPDHLSEDFLRKKRYAFFDTVLRENSNNILFLGHHQDDQVETILMNLFRGTGPKGVLGMLNKPDRRIFRPLLELRADEIRKILSDYDIPYRMDSSNLHRDYLRNRVRLELVPTIRTIFPPEGDRHVATFSHLFQRELKDRESGDWLSNTFLLIRDQRFVFSLPRYRNLTPYRQTLFCRWILDRILLWNLPSPEERNLLRSLSGTPVFEGHLGRGWHLGIEFQEAHLVYKRNLPEESSGNWFFFLKPDILEDLRSGKRSSFLQSLPGGGRLEWAWSSEADIRTPWEEGTRPSRSCRLSPGREGLFPLLVAGPGFPAVREAFRREGMSLGRLLSRRRFPSSFKKNLPVLMAGESLLWAPHLFPLQTPDGPLRNETGRLSVTYQDAKGDIWKRSSANP
jgi:tRNA(Ile)-lysidine synthase|uniref:tRNA(Ile)-lysidine synthase n=1 Tax=Leptospirillum ferriphilum TaxID=178606 RepID=A0A2I2MI21_9BACT